jgi:hypothetical protein
LTCPSRIFNIASLRRSIADSPSTRAGRVRLVATPAPAWRDASVGP